MAMKTMHLTQAQMESISAQAKLSFEDKDCSYNPENELFTYPEEKAQRFEGLDKNLLVTVVPGSVHPVQMRKALRQSGLKPVFDSWLASQDEDVQDTWEYSTVIHRNNPLIAAAATATNRTEKEIDDLFRLAASL